MNIDDHPDLSDLRLSKREERRAQAEARRRQRQAFGMPPEPTFLRRHRNTVVAVGVLAALVVAGAVFVNRVRPDVTETSPSTTDTVMDQKPGVDLSQPFLGTPAAGWADDEAGIVAPAAAPVGSHTAEQVAAGYERVRQVLVTARLDPAVIVGHDYGPYLALLAPNARASVRPDLAVPSSNSYQWATRIADGFHLLPTPPKVTGSMWAAEDADGALLVHTNYVFAYAFDPVDPEVVHGPMDIVTVDRFDADYSVTDNRWAAADRGLWPGSVSSYGYSIACAAYKGGQLAPSYSERVVGEGAEDVDEKDAFDPKRPMPTTSSCPD
jgi:hypothetical protein